MPKENSTSEATEALPPELVADLADARAYPDDASAEHSGVETLQTHLSHLYLTEDRVVKLRKAVELPFVDFSKRAERIADCHREVALNRRLAPDVYLGVAAVEYEDGRYVQRDRWIDESKSRGAEQAECVVVMRRLEDAADALSMLERGALQPEHLDATAAKLASFHDRVGLGCPAPWDPDGWWEHCYAPIASTLDALAASDAVDHDALTALQARCRARFQELRGPLERRRRDGKAVEGHGDVHLQHVWFEHGAKEPVLIDCLEFDSELRRTDAANEVAFLAMDLAYRERTDLAARFLWRYARARDDFDLFRVVDAYQAYRAAVRGKVAALAAADDEIPQQQRRAAKMSAERHLELASRFLAPKSPGTVVVVCGTVGVGKSTVAEEIASGSDGVVISSDRVRKRLAGMAPNERGDSKLDTGLYAPDKKDAVYRGLLERAAPIVESGRVAILDATFSRAADRAAVLAWAFEHRAEALLVRVQCDEQLVLSRLAKRSERGDDPSDAGPELVAPSRDRFEEPIEWPDKDRYETWSDRTERPALEGLFRRLASRSS